MGFLKQVKWVLIKLIYIQLHIMVLRSYALDKIVLSITFVQVDRSLNF
jgi:hypothetical protein